MLRVHWDLNVSIALRIIQEYILNEIANSKTSSDVAPESIEI